MGTGERTALTWPAAGAGEATSVGARTTARATKAAKAAKVGKGAKEATPEAAAAPSTVAHEPTAPPALGEIPLGRVFVEAFERLSDRLLERMRALRSDVEADLGALRADLAALREAVEAMGDRAQGRQLRAGLDELHAEVLGLRRAVLEWPELEQLSHDVTAVRGDLAFLFESAGQDGRAPSELLGELQAVVARLEEASATVAAATPAAADDGPLLEEVAALRAELAEVRRRVARPAGFDGDQLEWLVATVADRVAARLRGADARERPARLAD
jgi:hypothetical protein